jgi:hypothetical protein
MIQMIQRENSEGWERKGGPEVHSDKGNYGSKEEGAKTVKKQEDVDGGYE